MLPFNGSNPRSILVLDNCSIHHVQQVKDLMNTGILALYLPIEETFSFIKYYLRDHDEIWQATGDPKPLIKAAFEAVTTEHCNKWITDVDILINSFDHQTD